jgi:TPR repeat protein
MTVPTASSGALTPAALETFYIDARYLEKVQPGVKLEVDAAAAGQNHLAKATVGALFWKGCKAYPKDVTRGISLAQEALPWLQAEAAKGSKYAQLHLGSCYEDGRGVAKDEGEARRLYTLAVDQGSALAQYNLGECTA